MGINVNYPVWRIEIKRQCCEVRFSSSLHVWNKYFREQHCSAV